MPKESSTAVAAPRPGWGLFVCLSIALVLRCLVIWLHSEQLTTDRDAYLAMARGIAAGRGLVDPGQGTATAFRPPLYPVQIGLTMWVLPAGLAVAGWNLAWGLIAVWATWQAGQWLLPRGGSALAALLVSIDPLLLQYSAQPMTEVTCCGLSAVLLYWLVRSDVGDSAREWGIGLIFGALVLCRPTFWPLAGLFAVGWLGSHLIGGSQLSPIRIPWRGVAATLAVVAPWVIRNELTLGSPILMTTHGGYTLLLANNPAFYDDVVDRNAGSDWPDASFDRWQQWLQASLKEELGAQATEIDRDRWQSGTSRKFIKANPGRFLKAAWFRVRMLWSAAPQRDPSGNSRLVFAVGVYYTGVLLAFGVALIVRTVQLLVSIRSPGVNRKWWYLVAMVLTVQLVHLVYWTNIRMRAPIVPAISLFVAMIIMMRPLSRLLPAQSTTGPQSDRS